DAGGHRGPRAAGGHMRMARAGRQRGEGQAMTINPDMNLGMTEQLKPIHEKVAKMVRDEIMPLDEEYLAEVGKDGDRWRHTARQMEILEGLKAKARERGLWNFWLTDSKRGYGLTTVEYAYLAEEMGKA